MNQKTFKTRTVNVFIRLKCFCFFVIRTITFKIDLKFATLFLIYNISLANLLTMQKNKEALYLQYCSSFFFSKQNITSRATMKKQNTLIASQRERFHCSLQNEVLVLHCSIKNSHACNYHGRMIFERKNFP